MAGRDVSTARAFMTADLPAWIPAGPGTSPALPQAEGRVGRVIVLLGTEGALAAGWAGSVAVDLADDWGRTGARVVVADAGLSTPLLHEALGIPNHEGLVDALRWGVSVQRVIQRPEGRRFLALTAGTAVADGTAVLGLPRWKALCAGFREAGVTLAVLVPSWEEGLEAVLAQADGLVVIAERGEDAGPVLAGLEGLVVAVTGRDGAPLGGSEPDETPEGAAGEERAGDDLAPELSQVEEVWTEPSGEAPVVVDFGAPDELPHTAVDVESAGESGWGTLPDEGAPMSLTPQEDLEREPASPSWEEDAFEDGAEAVADDAPDDLEGAWAPVPLPPSESGEGDDFVLPEPIPIPPSLEEIVEESEAAPRKGRSATLLFLLLLVAVGVVVVGWFGYIEIPGVTPDPTTPSSTPTPVVAAPMPPTEVSPALAYSLALGAYQDGVVAGERVATLAGQVPGVLFQAVPVEVDGTLYYRVLAGPAADSAAVLALVSRVAGMTQGDASQWVARWTPLAFQLGEMPDREAADRRVGALNGLGVSGYVLAVDYSDGSVRYRVFAGAFADATEASYLSGLLEERGLSSATLSDRIGRLPE